MNRNLRASIAAVATLMLLAVVFLMLRGEKGDEALAERTLPSEAIAELADEADNGTPAPPDDVHTTADGTTESDPRPAERVQPPAEDSDTEPEEIAATDGPRTVLRGRVFLPDGVSPAAGATVTAYWLEFGFRAGEGPGGEASITRDGIEATTESASDGRYEVAIDRGLPLFVEAALSNYGSVSRRVGHELGPPRYFRDGVGIYEADITLDEAREVFGRVVDPDGKGVAGARLRLEHAPFSHGGMVTPRTARTVSSSDGSFRFEGIPRRSVPASIYVLHDDFADTVFALATDRDSPHEIVLVREGIGMRGRVVTFGDEEPVAGATVVFVPTGDARDGHAPFVNPPIRTAETGPDGRYEIAGLLASNYHVAARFDELHSLQEDGSPVVTVRRPVEGWNEVEDLRLHPGYLIEGRVLDLVTSEPIADATVEIAFDVASQGPIRTASDAEGRYSLGPFYGHGDRHVRQAIDMRASKEGYIHVRSPHTGRVPMTFSPNRLIYDLDVRLSPTIRISGTVVHPGGVPLPGVHVSQNATPETMDQWSESDRRGRFEVRAPVRSRAQVRGRAPGYAMSYSEYIVTEESDIDGVELVMDPGATIEALVRDEENRPLANAEVHLMRYTLTDRNGWVDVNERKTTDADGMTRFEVLPSTHSTPGFPAHGSRYEVYATRSGYVPSERQRVDVSSGKTERVEFVLRSGEAEHSIAGRVVYPDDEGVAGASIRVRAVHEVQWGGGATSDDEGRFRIEGLYDASYDVLAHVDGGGNASEAQIAAGTEDLLLVLPFTYMGLVLEIVDARTGEPVVNATVTPSTPLDMRSHEQWHIAEEIRAGTNLQFRIEAPGYRTIASHRLTIGRSLDDVQEEVVRLVPLTE